MNNLTDKYNQLSSDFSRKDYAGTDVAYFMLRRAQIVLNWGVSLNAGDSVLELGCGDGTLASILINNGLKYSGIDQAEGMILQTRKFIAEACPPVAFRAEVADVDTFKPETSVDAVIGLMRSFFHYVEQPEKVLSNLRPYIRKKVILDFNPRQISPRTACKIVQDAGFTNVTYRGFFVPSSIHLPVFVREGLHSAETIPVIKGLALKFRFHALVKGQISDS